MVFAIKKCFPFFMILMLLLITGSSLKAQNNFVMKGTITNSVTEETLPGANVIVVGTGLGAASDIYGKYSINNLPKGNIKVKVSYIGYKSVEKEIRLTEKITEMDFQLEPESILGEEIVVTAQAKGQTEAINQQLSSKAIVNVVSSARIQEIPDDNAAESLGRLPGVSVLRSGGEGSKVVIRGLDPKFNNVQMAGVKMAATGSDDRSVDLSMISPYMLDGIEVTKAITPDMDADALGGAINFKLREAQQGLKYDLLLQGGYNDLKNTYSDYKIVGNGSNRFFNDKLGMFLQFDVEKRNRSGNAMNSGWGLNWDRELIEIKSVDLYDINRNKNRYGGTVVLDYKLPSGSVILNNFISRSETLTKKYTESYGIDLSTHEYNTSELENNLNVFINSLSYNQDLPLFKINVEASHSYSEQKSPDNISFSFYGDNALTTFDRFHTPPYRVPYYAVNNIDRTNLSEILTYNYASKDRELAGALNLSRKINLSKKISAEFKTGGKYGYKDRSYDYNSEGGLFNYGSGQETKNAILNSFPWMLERVPLGNQYFPYSLFINPNYDGGEFLKGEYTLGPIANIDLLNDVIDVVRKYKGTEAYRSYAYSSATNDYSGNEYYRSVFGMGDFKYGDLVQVIAGLRYEEVEREYTGVAGNSAIGQSNIAYTHKDTTTSITHSNLLPMVHVRYKPFSWFDIRFAYTNTLSRPDFNTIIPRINIGSETVIWNNYRLKPAHSENFDLYLSFYENALGLFTIGGFTKKINDLIYLPQGKVILRPEEIGMDESVERFKLTTYINNEFPAHLWGIEVSWQTHFWYLPGVLKGLVLDVNYTHNYSKTKYTLTRMDRVFDPATFSYKETYVDTFYESRMIYQPDDIINVSLGYDYSGFSIRASLLYQSDIFASTDFHDKLRQTTDDHSRWDISIKQELPLDGLQLYLNLININGAVDRNILNGNGEYTNEDYYGKGVDLGVRYRLK